MIIDLIILLLAIVFSIMSSLILLQRIKLSPLLEVKLVSMAFMFQSVGYMLFLPTALLDGSASLNQLEVATVTYRLGLTLILIWGLILSVATSLPSLKEDLVSMYKVIILFATFSISGTYNALTVEVIADSGVVRFKFDAIGVIILALSISLIVLLVANRSYYMYRRVSEEALLKYIILMVTFGLTTVLILTANLLSPLPPLPLFSAVFSGSVATFILALMMHYHEHLYFGSGTILYGIYLLNRNDFSVIHAKMIQNDFLNEKTFVKKLVSLQQSLTELVGGQEEVKEIHWRDKVILFEERGNILITFLVSQKNWIVLSLLHYIAMNGGLGSLVTALNVNLTDLLRTSYDMKEIHFGDKSVVLANGKNVSLILIVTESNLVVKSLAEHFVRNFEKEFQLAIKQVSASGIVKTASFVRARATIEKIKNFFPSNE